MSKRRRLPPVYQRSAFTGHQDVHRLPETSRRQRYRRAYDGAGDPRINGTPESGRRRSRRSVMDRFRQTPLRDGLVGLAMVGAATPLAMTRLGSLRTDPSHEDTLPVANAVRPLTDATVGQAWRTAADRAETDRATERDTLIQDKVERYGEMGLDRKLAESIYDLALEADIDPDVAFGLVRTESEFNPTAKSHVGAIGLTQLMPATARYLKPGVTVSDLHQPEVNMRIGFKYLRELIDKYDGNQELALLAYNRGPGTVDRVLKRGGDPDNGYARAVITGEGVHR
jgi:hypothetical protein